MVVCLLTRQCMACRWACSWGTYCMGWDVVQNWMLTGHFEWRVPLRGVVHTWQHKGGKPPMDWWGIQYYSRCAFLSLNWQALNTTQSPLTYNQMGALHDQFGFGLFEVFGTTCFFVCNDQPTPYHNHPNLQHWQWVLASRVSLECLMQCRSIPKSCSSQDLICSTGDGPWHILRI